MGTNASPVVDEFVSGPEQEQEHDSWEDHVQEEARLIYGRLKRAGVPVEGSEYADLLDVLRRGEVLPGPDVLSDWLIMQYEQDGYLDPELAWFGAEADSNDSSKDRKKELEELRAATVSKWTMPRGYEEEDLRLSPSDNHMTAVDDNGGYGGYAGTEQGEAARDGRA